MKVSRTVLIVFLFAALARSSLLRAQSPTQGSAQSPTQSSAESQTRNSAQPQEYATITQVVDSIIARENELVQSLHKFTPRIEIYLQTFRGDRELGSVPARDSYFLGRLKFQKRIDESSFLPEPGLIKRIVGTVTDPFTVMSSTHYHLQALAYGVIMDDRLLDRQHYNFEFVRREFLSEVRCLVFDVTPRRHSGPGRFLGRIWVEDKDYNIVRFNGTYAPDPRFGSYFHLDSWRQNLQPGLWLPVYVYSEESDAHRGIRTLPFKAQTRIWGYALKGAGRQEELTRVLVDAPLPVRDSSDTARDLSPAESQRELRREAENNVLDRLGKAGLIAPDGEVNKVMETVVNNLIITNRLDTLPPVRCRVMLTYPLESFSVGYTIVLSRGLIDVLPDEASLAMMLAHELAHISLGQQMDSRYAFNDRLLMRDEEILSRLGFGLDSHDEADADAKAIEFLKNSPYKDKLSSAGLFLRAMEAEAPHTPKLFGASLGNRLAKGHQVRRTVELMTGAPELRPRQLDQIAALPLGSRIKVDPWSGRAMLMKTKPVALVSVREKMSFQVTPLFPYEKRWGEPQQPMAGQTQTDSEKATPR